MRGEDEKEEGGNEGEKERTGHYVHKKKLFLRCLAFFLAAVCLTGSTTARPRALLDGVIGSFLYGRVGVGSFSGMFGRVTTLGKLFLLLEVGDLGGGE
jgi:hypothetical protein